jgi:hypothetical protein
MAGEVGQESFYVAASKICLLPIEITATRQRGRLMQYSFNSSIGGLKGFKINTLEHRLYYC